MKTSFASHSVMITGATSGIGYETARLFLQKGFFTHLLGRKTESLESLKKEFPDQIMVHTCDLLKPQEIKKTVNLLLESTPLPMDTLINCAGIYERHGNDDVNSEEIWNRQYQVNVLAPVLLVQNLIPSWKKLGKASVVNVSSTLGLRPATHVAAYGAMKAALIHWTQSLALEEGPWGLRANCVAPGIVDTPIHSFHQMNESEKSKIVSSMNQLQPLGRIGNAQEIAKSIYFLASAESAWTTGAVLSVDGGINLQ